MKELLVIVGTVILGCMIFDMIAGETGSLKAASGEKMQELLLWYGSE